ncbi:MAG: hypothetical protein LBT03_02335 [Holosporales bacterium]|jgi:trk system potassium uptake protein TrkH|nr:hypothetical protein [Holosporales bacterium]
MANLKAVAVINGIAICGLAIAMTIPLLFDIVFASGECIRIFVPSILVCIFLGGLAIFSSFTKDVLAFSRNDSFLLVASLWIVISTACSIPFCIYADSKLSFMSAIFESVSGITTTGATIYPDVEILPEALNLWRIILHFIGGVGIVAIGIFVFPLMRIGGMQLFATENSDKSKKFLPRVSQMVGFFIGIYIAMICIFAILLKISGMNLFDSICYSISAISTGGFSTKNSGINWYKNGVIEFVISFAMFVGSFTFLEFARILKNRGKGFLSNQQSIGYLKVVIIMIVVPIIWNIITTNSEMTVKVIADHVFQVMSAISTTGYDCTKNYIQPIVLISLALIGGCSGSTSGGIKIFRVQIIYALIKHHIQSIINPNNVIVPKYQNKKIENELIASVVSFIALLVIVFIVSSLVIGITSEKDVATCCYAVLSCLFNLGYDVHFTEFSNIPKFMLVLDMITGRLEVIPIIVVLSRRFRIFN